MMALGDQCIAQMRAEEAGGAGDQDRMSRQNTVPLVSEAFLRWLSAANSSGATAFSGFLVYTNGEMLQS
jgi:hypothetical protein